MEKMWTAIQLKQEGTRKDINTLAEDFNRYVCIGARLPTLTWYSRSPEWMAAQLYTGDKIQQAPDDENLFSAYVFDQAKIERGRVGG